MTPNDGITDEQQYAAARADLATFPGGLDPLTAWLSGSAWARTQLAAQEPTDAESIARRNFGDDVVDRLAAHFGITQGRADAAQIIDQHRVEKRWVGDGVRIECHCRHESSAVWDPAAGPFTEENNTHRAADRLHAVHVSDMLARAARGDEEKRDG